MPKRKLHQTIRDWMVEQSDFRQFNDDNITRNVCHCKSIEWHQNFSVEIGMNAKLIFMSQSLTSFDDALLDVQYNSCTSIHKHANKIVHLPTTPNIFTRMHIWNTINRAFAKIQLGIMHFNCKYTHTHAHRHAQIKYNLYQMKYESNKLNEIKKQQLQPESNFVETIQYDF